MAFNFKSSALFTLHIVFLYLFTVYSVGSWQGSWNSVEMFAWSEASEIWTHSEMHIRPLRPMIWLVWKFLLFIQLWELEFVCIYKGMTVGECWSLKWVHKGHFCNLLDTFPSVLNPVLHTTLGLFRSLHRCTDHPLDNTCFLYPCQVGYILAPSNRILNKKWLI